LSADRCEDEDVGGGLALWRALVVKWGGPNDVILFLRLCLTWGVKIGLCLPESSPTFTPSPTAWVGLFPKPWVGFLNRYWFKPPDTFSTLFGVTVWAA
jgi:hypothetical protein